MFCNDFTFGYNGFTEFEEPEADMAEWNPTCNRFVGYFDIMGFKDMVFRNSHAHVMKKMNAVREITEVIEEESKALSKKRKSGQKKPNSFSKAIVLPVIFSDSILFISEDDSEASATRILFEASYLLAFSFDEGIPIKGALAYGKQTADFNRSLHFGKPLIDAHELQDELHMYGVVLHHSIERYLRRHNLLNNDPLLCQCELPFKNGKVHHCCIDPRFFYPFIGEKKTGTKKLIPDVLKMYNTVSGNTRRYVDNTLQFINAIEANKPKK
jgi:hypothetical protein